MDETKAIELAAEPHKIIDPIQCNEVISFLNACISDMALAEFEREVAASNHQVILLNTEGKTNKVAEAEFKISEPYKEWKKLRLELQKFRAYRQVLRKKEESLQFKPRGYGDYRGAV